MKQYILIGNYGNESIALLQWCIEHEVPDVIFLNVATGWAANEWQLRVAAGQNYAQQHGIAVKQLSAVRNFSDLILDRKQFPSKKFQWCAGFLKGIILNQYLDEIDPTCEATMLFAKRRTAARINQQLPEIVNSSEYYNHRKTWFPLLECSDDSRNELITRAGFAVLPHPSLECSPCIHATINRLQQLTVEDIAKTTKLEQQLQQSFFDPSEFGEQIGVNNCVKWAKQQSPPKDQELENFVGCGSPWGCGE